MARKVLTLIKLQVPGGQANPAPPVGPALGQHGVNIMEFCKAFNAQTQQDTGTIIPVEITVFEDRSFTFITKTPPAAVLIKQAIGLEKGSGEPNRNKVGTITRGQVRADRRAEAARPQRARRGPGIQDHRGHRALDGRGGVRLMAKHGKRYRESYEKVDRDLTYEPADAVRLIKEFPPTKFDQTVEVHIRTGLNVRHADQQLRGTIALPNGLGKDMTVAVFAKGDKAREAEEAGADFVGAEDLAERVQEEGFTDFDVAIATPDMMPVVGRLGRILGPAGQDAQPEGGHGDDGRGQGGVRVQGGQGRVPHRPHGDRPPAHRQAQLRGAAALLENYAALIDEIVRAKPAAAKGRYLRSGHAHHQHGPGREGGPVAYPQPRRGAGRGSLSV